MLFSDSRWCLCVEFWIWDTVHHEVVFPIVWERLHNLPSYFMRVYTSPLYSLECHAEVCVELLEFVLCNSQLPASWIFFAAFSLKLLSLCESFACTSRPCTSSFDQLRLSDVRVKKFHVCNFDLGFPRIAPNVEAFTTPNISECYFWSFQSPSCLANNSRLHFYWQLLRRILST